MVQCEPDQSQLGKQLQGRKPAGWEAPRTSLGEGRSPSSSRGCPREQGLEHRHRQGKLGVMGVGHFGTRISQFQLPRGGKEVPSRFLSSLAEGHQPEKRQPSIAKCVPGTEQGISFCHLLFMVVLEEAPLPRPPRPPSPPTPLPFSSLTCPRSNSCRAAKRTSEPGPTSICRAQAFPMTASRAVCHQCPWRPPRVLPMVHPAPLDTGLGPAPDPTPAPAQGLSSPSLLST